MGNTWITGHKPPYTSGPEFNRMLNGGKLTVIERTRIIKWIESVYHELNLDTAGVPSDKKTLQQADDATLMNYYANSVDAYNTQQPWQQDSISGSAGSSTTASAGSSTTAASAPYSVSNDNGNMVIITGNKKHIAGGYLQPFTPPFTKGQIGVMRKWMETHGESGKNDLSGVTDAQIPDLYWEAARQGGLQVPGYNRGAIPGLPGAHALDGINAFLSNLTSGSTWTRVGEAAIGIILVAIALKGMTDSRRS